MRATLASTLPDNRKAVLPTRFGNTIRAFEAYSRVVYGFESVEGFNRVEPFIPDSLKDAVSAAKSRMDVWINFSVLAVLFAVLALLEFNGVALCRKLWLVGAVVLFVGATMHLARAAAYTWGVAIKSGVDIGLPKLAEDMGFELPSKGEDQHAFWLLLSQHFLLRDNRTLALLDSYRKHPSPKHGVVRRKPPSARRP